MNYLRFFLSNKRLIGFGFSLAFFSSFGQTFLISLYVPYILKEFNLSNGSFGALYGAATILSAVCLVFVGRLIDSCNLMAYTLMTVILLILSSFFVSISPNLIFIFLGLWGLRFAGQGLLSHISSTSISKFFVKQRGSALSLSVMGYSAGEALFPLLLSFTIAWVGWRYSLFLSGILISLTLVPFVIFALYKNPKAVSLETPENNSENNFSSFRLWRDKRFLIIVTSVFILPFIITGLFFHQLILAEQKGWSVEWLAASFLGYALGRSVFSLLSGKLIDKFTALTLFPFHLVPFFVALCCLYIFDHPITAPLYLTLAGITMGLGSTIKTALLAEIYGTQNLGSIRAMSTTIMVFGTALSPAIFGFFLDINISMNSIVLLNALIVLSIILLSQRLAFHTKLTQDITFEMVD